MSIIDPKPLPAFSSKNIVNFWRMVDRRGADECWPWRGTRVNGYGRLSVQSMDGKRSLLAHRVAYNLTTGVDPAGKPLCHSCDNPPCCNPTHVSPGSQALNAAQRQARGRGSTLKGDTHPCSTITSDQVREIRRLSAQGKKGVSIAAMFGVSETLVSSIIHRRSWASVI